MSCFEIQTATQGENYQNLIIRDKKEIARTLIYPIHGFNALQLYCLTKKLKSKFQFSFLQVPPFLLPFVSI